MFPSVVNETETMAFLCPLSLCTTAPRNIEYQIWINIIINLKEKRMFPGYNTAMPVAVVVIIRRSGNLQYIWQGIQSS
jgi:hypothetical protein